MQSSITTNAETVTVIKTGGGGSSGGGGGGSSSGGGSTPGATSGNDLLFGTGDITLNGISGNDRYYILDGTATILGLNTGDSIRIKSDDGVTKNAATVSGISGAKKKVSHSKITTWP